MLSASDHESGAMVDVGRWSWQETGRGIGAVEGVVEPREAMPQAAALGWVIGSAGQTPLVG